MKRLAIIACLVLTCFSVYDILNYGAIPHSDTVTDQFINQRAILKAIADANKSMT